MKVPEYKNKIENIISKLGVPVQVRKVISCSNLQVTVEIFVLSDMKIYSLKD